MARLPVLSEAERLTTTAEAAIAELDRMIGATDGHTPAHYGRRLQTVQDPIDEWKAFLKQKEAALKREMRASPSRGTALAERFGVIFRRLYAAAEWLSLEGSDD